MFSPCDEISYNSDVTSLLLPMWQNCSQFHLNLVPCTRKPRLGFSLVEDAMENFCFNLGVAKDPSLLGYDAVSLGLKFQTFRAIVLPSSSRSGSPRRNFHAKICVVSCRAEVYIILCQLSVDSDR